MMLVIVAWGDQKCHISGHPYMTSNQLLGNSSAFIYSNIYRCPSFLEMPDLQLLRFSQTIFIMPTLISRH